MLTTLEQRERVFSLIKYSPHTEQLKFHNSMARFRVACCGRRFGKSTMAARDLEPAIMDMKHRYMFWCVGPTYDLGEKEFRIVWNDLMVGQALGKDKRIKRAYNKKQGTMYIEMPWGTRLEVRSADHPENLVGEALDGVIMAEAAKMRPETWSRYLRAALSDKRGFATFPTTPEGYNWLYKLWQMGRNPDFPLWASWQFPTWSNTRMFPGGRQDPEILELEKTTPEEEFLQEYAAEFGAFVGKIYKEWDEKTHVKKIEYNPNLPNYMAIDWGFTSPLAAIEFQVDAQDNVYVWREHYKSWVTLQEHFKIMKSRHQPEGYKIDLIFSDAADPQAVAETNASFGPCIALDEAKENWRQGVMLVKRFLRLYDTGLVDEWERPIERPKFWVDHSCENTISEFNSYRSKTAPKGNNAPELPQKLADHCMDAIRYGLMHLFELGVTYHLADVYDHVGDASTVAQDDFTTQSLETYADAMGDGGMFTMGDRF
jgi:hypothetical protein